MSLHEKQLSTGHSSCGETAMLHISDIILLEMPFVVIFFFRRYGKVKVLLLFNSLKYSVLVNLI